jgi:UvrD-like helicase C-terminal domain
MEVAFATQPNAKYRYWASDVDEQLELAYALTVHKAQGSDFEIVFFIVPEKAATLSRELLYTGLTRFRRKLVLLLQTDTAMLERMRRPEQSQTLLRKLQPFRAQSPTRRRKRAICESLDPPYWKGHPCSIKVGSNSCRHADTSWNQLRLRSATTVAR